MRSSTSSAALLQTNLCVSTTGSVSPHLPQLLEGLVAALPGVAGGRVRAFVRGAKRKIGALTDQLVALVDVQVLLVGWLYCGYMVVVLLPVGCNVANKGPAASSPCLHVCALQASSAKALQGARAELEVERKRSAGVARQLEVRILLTNFLAFSFGLLLLLCVMLSG